MNAETNTDLPQAELLETYIKVSSGQPVTLKFEQIEELHKLKDELEIAESEAKPVFEEIEQLESRIKELKESVDKRLLYLKYTLKSGEPVKPMNHNASVSLSPLNETTVLEILKSNSYGLGNADLCRKLGMTGNKAEQNKAYSVAKQLEAKGLVKSENRVWKAL